MKKKKSGSIEVITGGMFSGKTEELIRRVRRAQIVSQKVQVFKPRLDYRGGEEKVSSHNGVQLDATPVEDARQILGLVDSDTTVVAIDEAQFFDKDIVDVVKKLANNDKRVIIAGLDMNFRGEPFGFMGDLMAIADEMAKLHAICQVCGEDASFSQRLINGKPASYDAPTVLVGGSDVYQARCRHCYRPPKRKSRKK